MKSGAFLSTGFFYQCNLVTEKCFVLRYDKATIKKEVANMKIIPCAVGLDLYSRYSL